ncbi:hypothetical protein TNCV_4978791 [Trichonephila clavipes]|nr:hypothetical protein TNCV_4978791 [Trichonephila clavipes]
MSTITCCRSGTCKRCLPHRLPIDSEHQMTAYTQFSVVLKLQSSFHMAVPSHVGIPGNTRTVQNAKQGAESFQLEDPLTLKTAMSMITTCIDKYMQPQPKKPRALESHGKPWPLCVLSQGTWREPRSLSTFT